VRSLEVRRQRSETSFIDENFRYSGKCIGVTG
jgi:hypothetical protein